MKRLGLVFTTLALFAFTVYLAFMQGSVPLADQQDYLQGVVAPLPSSHLVYSGIRADVAVFFASVFNGLLQFTGKNMLGAIILLGLIVELVLLYPSVRIQLKQKKIHLFHKKLVDRFNRGELSVSNTENELHKLYDVNETIHRRGAGLVVIQIALFFFTFWGLNLMVNAPGLLAGNWSVANFSLLSTTDNFLIPLVAGLIYFFHAMVKMYYKQREDYISPAQSTMAFIIAVIGAAVVYWFASIFAVAMTLYFVTLVTFATLRYMVVEQHAKAWGAMAQRELIQMLKEASTHKDRFQYLSRVWNHLPVVRHINFHLLEEALSMTLGLLLALTFFGAFQDGSATGFVMELVNQPIAQFISTNLIA